MKKYFLLISIGIFVIIALLFLDLFGIPLPAKKYTYTGPRQPELIELSDNSSLPKEQEQLEQVLDAVYIADIQTLVSLTQSYYKDHSTLPWQKQSKPQLAREVKGIFELRLAGGVSDDLFQKMLNKDIYLADDGKKVYWCVDLLRNNDRELWESTYCKNMTKCYCNVFERM